MFDFYFEKFNEKAPVATTDKALISKHLSLKSLKKKDILLQEGAVCKHTFFVQKGMLRAYTIDENGNEHIVQFAPEGWHIADLYSFFTEEPATLFIDAVEDSEIILIAKEDHEILLSQSHCYETFTRELITAAYVALQQRFNSSMSSSPDMCYSDFMNRYPNIANRVPQHMIASYLGLTPETLSRVRRRIAKAK
ncbi:cAMP-binding domain of CRP or a regulatory subunit of cAMP-dependent protein kinases [Pustulibacterium marinum]|uniref:cAMP-binding domain of CRP or a regulatory subunit of cAMP-dependent protein kinases n=1 Tax=Pustulibacterium marinum TaxID=1224947 RepID=A0A1I7HI32_9FLAO|nr:Crp/Fnr family transcriptional regulator [Pustulibacterium marinum]SFU60365.1 cAMP-binding domain of CRP or a regulatory subunit of cAMP-dependent protein kinases [Pustulibacterium marinum]